MSKEKVIILITSWIMVIFTMLIIVNFSLQDGAESSNTSDTVVDSIIEVLPNKDTITTQQKQTITFSVRKLAHFGVYMLLGFTTINAMSASFEKKYIFSIVLSPVLPILYAMFDEFVIQSSSNGRAPSWIDVLIDSSGAIIGILLFIVIMLIFNILRKYLILKRKS